jgi:hypothetical protein
MRRPDLVVAYRAKPTWGRRSRCTWERDHGVARKAANIARVLPRPAAGGISLDSAISSQMVARVAHILPGQVRPRVSRTQ